MDIYYAVTNYHLICCILHKMKHNDNDSKILISQYLTDSIPGIEKKVDKLGIFDEILIIEVPEFKVEDEFLSKKELQVRIDEISNKIEKRYGNIIRSAKNLYLCCDFDELGIYVISNNIKYNYFEDGCGIFSRENIVLKVLHQRKLFIKELECLGNNENVINRYGSMKDQLEGYYNPKDINFSVKDILKTLSKKEMSIILGIYDINKIKVKNGKLDLFLTMHYNELKSDEEQKEIYTYLLDYFKTSDTKLIIKPHPADSIFNYEKLFKGCYVLNRYMPSELFPYCIDAKFEQGITCWSTAIFGLKNMIKSIVSFDNRIDTTYKDFDKYYSIVMYLKKIKTEKKVNLRFVDINEVQIEMLMKKYFKTYIKFYTINSKDNNMEQIYIVYTKTESLKGEKLISLTPDFDSDYMLSIRRVYKNRKSEDFISLYNFSLVNFNCTKELEYSKCKLEIEQKEKNQYIKILSKIIQEKDDDIKGLNNNIYKNNEHIAILQNEINNKDNMINEIYNSTSWKITKPIRKVIDIIRKFK